MSHVYTLVPSPEDDTLTDDDITETEGQSMDGGSVTDTEICDSDEDIVITRLARAAQDTQPGSYTKSKRIKSGTSPTKSPLKNIMNNFSVMRRSECHITEAAKSEYYNITSTDPELLQSELKKALIEIKEICKTCNTMEEELMRATVQLSEYNQKIEELQTEINEEKQNCEEIRKLYMEVKDTNDVLEHKLENLRDELKRVIEGNDPLNKINSLPAEESDNLGKETSASQAKSLSQTGMKSRTRSPSRNQSSLPKTYQAKPSARKKSIDLRTLPQTKDVPSLHLRLVHISEENADLKTKLNKLIQEKQLFEKKKIANEELLNQIQQSLSRTEEDLKKITEERLDETQRRLKLQREIEERNVVVCNLMGELQELKKKVKPIDEPNADNDALKVNKELYKAKQELKWQKEQVAKLQKEIETSNYLNEDLESNNANLENQVGKLENDIVKWKDELDSVVSECQVFEAELALNRKQQFDIRKEIEILRNENERLQEENSFLKELKKKLEVDYQQRKERTKVAEGETLLLQRANSELRSKLDSMQEYNDQLRVENLKAKDEDGKSKSATQKASYKELEQKQELSKDESKKRTAIPKPTERRKNRERSPSPRAARYPESKIPSKIKMSESITTKYDEKPKFQSSEEQNISKEKKMSSQIPDFVTKLSVGPKVQTEEEEKLRKDKINTFFAPSSCTNEKSQVSSDNSLFFDNQTASLQRQLLNLEKNISTYKTDLDKAEAKIESLSTELEIAHGERKDLELRLQAREKAIDEFDADNYRELEERHETITAEYNVLLDENSKLQLRLLNIDDERDAMGNGLSNIKEQNELLKQQLFAADRNRIQLEVCIVLL